MHPFDHAIQLEPAGTGRLQGRTSEEYWNFVTPFGGITAATVLNAILMRSDRLGDPVALTVNFISGIQPGPFVVDVELLRSSRSTQHWSLRLSQGEESQPLVSALAVFGARRQTWNLAEASAPPVAPFDPEQGRMPLHDLKWPSMYAMHYVRGQLMRENPDSVSHHWIRDAQPRTVDFASLCAMCDAFFPRMFLRRPQAVPIATVSLNIYFHADAQELAAHGTEPLLGVARANVFHEGYFDQEGQLWGGNRLFATTQQIVWFKQ